MMGFTHTALLVASVLVVSAGCAAPPKLSFPSVAVPYARPTLSLQPSLFRPAQGTPPFPAVVVLHSCAGLKPSVFDWAGRLTGEGYVALVIDSNTPRGTTNNCIPLPGGQRYAYPHDVAEDAFAALAHLRTLPFVDGERIGVMGFSYGAMAALRTASASYRRYAPGRRSFQAVAAFYPTCAGSHPNGVVHESINNLYDDVEVPLLLLLGGLDDESPSAPCVEIAGRLRAAGRPVSWKLYPDATHGFDLSFLGSQPYVSAAGARGTFVYRYHPEATADAIREVSAHFARHLKR